MATTSVNAASAAQTVTTVFPPPPPPQREAAGKPPRLQDTQACKPNYPMAAIRALAQGRTTLAIEVDETGKVTDVSVKGASGPTREHQLLDETAALAFRNCHFEPALDENGRPTPGHTLVTYRWALD